ncbi:MAG: dTMP kinase [Desulfomonilaceae bacterium]|nr:dTMP kinase [Desulfomonilaceae bacterium]
MAMIADDHRRPGSTGAVPLFVVFEGIDGCGKTLQAKMLAERLSREGFRVVLTAEPSDGPMGTKIRSLDIRPTAEEEARLFTEDRRDHVNRVIRPALKDGRIVICDRYVYSSAAYQGARGIDPAKIISRNRSFAVPPDVIFLLEVPVETALHRIRAGRSGGFSSFEDKTGLEAVDRIYRDLKDPAIVRIDGTGTVESIHETILRILRGLIRDEADSPECVRVPRGTKREP